MKTKIIPCPVCDGKGYTLWVNTTDQSCSTGSKTCPHCNGTGVREVEQTNADRIRAMSDEELAQLLAHETYRMASPVFEYLGQGITEEFIYALRLKWLKQPVKDGENDG